MPEVPETLELNYLTIYKRLLKSTRVKLKILRGMCFLSLIPKTKRLL
jgi:hypothetical protein